jgi:hypothetical protein
MIVRSRWIGSFLSMAICRPIELIGYLRLLAVDRVLVCASRPIPAFSRQAFYSSMPACIRRFCRG